MRSAPSRRCGSADARIPKRQGFVQAVDHHDATGATRRESAEDVVTYAQGARRRTAKCETEDPPVANPRRPSGLPGLAIARGKSGKSVPSALVAVTPRRGTLSPSVICTLSRQSRNQRGDSIVRRCQSCREPDDGSLTERYDDRIAGVVSCYDRVVVTG